MLKRVASILALGAAAAVACSFADGWSIRYDTLAVGEVRVVQTRPVTNYMINEVAYRQDTLGVFRIDDFKTQISSEIHDSSLAFIARIDSGFQFYTPGDTVVAGLSPDFVLRDSAGAYQWPFFIRLRVDTVLSGTLPGKFIWIRGALSGNSCDVGSMLYFKDKPFLNLSKGLARNSDLKLPRSPRQPWQIVDAHWFDGRYLESPDFPGLKLDINTVLPGYSVPIRALPSSVRGSLHAPGKFYRPDGRVVPEYVKPGKNPAPIIR